MRLQRQKTTTLWMRGRAHANFIEDMTVFRSANRSRALPCASSSAKLFGRRQRCARRLFGLPARACFCGVSPVRVSSLEAAVPSRRQASKRLRAMSTAKSFEWRDIERVQPAGFSSLAAESVCQIDKRRQKPGQRFACTWSARTRQRRIGWLSAFIKQGHPMRARHPSLRD